MTIKRLVVLVALLLAGLTLASQPASVSAQTDPQPPWEGTLFVQTQRLLFNGSSLQPVSGEAPLQPNGAGETIGVYGHNASWVNISPYGHMVPKSSVANIVANDQFTQGWDARGEANPLWQGTANQACVIMVIDDASGVLRGSGVALTLNTTVGVYAVLGDHLQISPWLHFVSRSCVSGNFPTPSVSGSAIPAPAVMSSGQTVNTVSIEENLKGSCDEPHEIEYTQVMPDGNTLYVCKQAKILQPMGGDVLLYGMGTLVTVVSPIPGDEGLVISAWVANAAKASAVAVGVAASVASQASSSPIGSVQVAASAPLPVFNDMAAVQAALAALPALEPDVAIFEDLSEIELAAFDAAGQPLTRSFDAAALLSSLPAGGSYCIVSENACVITLPAPSPEELAHAIERHGEAKVLAIVSHLKAKPEGVFCSSFVGRCVISATIHGVGVGVEIILNNGAPEVPSFGRIVTVFGGSRVKVHRVRQSSCANYQVFPPPIFDDPQYWPVPEGGGLCFARGNHD